MTLAQRYDWSGTPWKAGLRPAAAHLKGFAHAADPRVYREYIGNISPNSFSCRGSDGVAKRADEVSAETVVLWIALEACKN